ncbi:putative 4-coumarate--CoA ligase 1 [Fusarium oxysporum f. sp. albedinis]|nr:putative 4-coumarate--CoA ligase 1 [Fusarium oxysporum f. sp. albedinis]
MMDDLDRHWLLDQNLESPIPAANGLTLRLVTSRAGSRPRMSYVDHPRPDLVPRGVHAQFSGVNHNFSGSNKDLPSNSPQFVKQSQPSRHL